jgi:hypothetical protein
MAYVNPEGISRREVEKLLQCFGGSLSQESRNNRDSYAMMALKLGKFIKFF